MELNVIRTGPEGTRHDPLIGAVVDAEDTDLADLLLRCCSEGLHRTNFWSFDALSTAFTRDRISRALQLEGVFAKHGDYSVAYILDRICPVYRNAADVPNTVKPHKPSSEPTRYLRILAILVLIDKIQDISHFIHEGVSDNDLPLRLERDELEGSRGKWKLKRRLGRQQDEDWKIVESTSRWRQLHLYAFDQYQHKMNVIFFEYEPHKEVAHYDLTSEQILPWLRSSLDEISPWMSGEYDSVRQVNIDPRSHNFDELRSITPITFQRFAIKSFWSKDYDHFKSEVGMLKRFNGDVHLHLVTLLATFTHQGTHHLIFPWAQCDLYKYWECNGAPSTGGDSQWLSTQILGLVSALDLIHNPAEDARHHKQYARHGDIKPENILWYKSSKDSRGLLVITDLGLSSINSKASRSNTPNNVIGFTPAYRSPEYDIQGGQISRSSDIWSLGCVFLEMACWMLDGIKLVHDFAEERREKVEDTPGVLSGGDRFFSVSKVEEEDATGSPSAKPTKHHVFALKKQWIGKLHAHPRCTMYIHDLLQLVENGMLRVERPASASDYFNQPGRASPQPRHRSGEIFAELEKLHEKVMNDAHYSTEPSPWPLRTHSDIRSPTVEANVNQGVAVRLAKDQNTRAGRARTHFPWLRVSHRVTESRSMPRTHTVVAEMKPDLPLADGRSILQEIDVVISNSSLSGDKNDPSMETATVDIFWELRNCLRTELDNSAEISSTLTINGDASHSWATSCREYVVETWGELGTTFLEASESALQKTVLLDQAITVKDPVISGLIIDVPHIDQELYVPATVTYYGTVSQVSIMMQFLAWIAATFRIPKAGELSCSTIAFEQRPGRLNYSLKLSALSSLDDRERGTCWKGLFPSTVMAYDFPVPRYSGTLGLCVPVQTMFELAEMISDTTLEDEEGNDNGVYFDGVIWRLYPTDYNPAEHTLQWHLVKRNLDETSGVGLEPCQDAPLDLLRGIDLQILANATAVLGYVREAAVQLGTKSRLKVYEHYCSSGARAERGQAEASLGAISMTSSILGHLSAGLTANLKYRTGLKDAKRTGEEETYHEVLTRAAAQPVILFDTAPEEERAWMVPQLSLVLDLYNFWAFSRMKVDKEVAEQVRYAEPGPDGGEMAKAALSDYDYANQVAIRRGYDGDSEFCVGAMIKRINRIVETRWCKNAESDIGAPGTFKIGRTSIYGWDWLELLPEFSPGVAMRRNVRPKLHWMQKGSKPNWFGLTDKIPVFVGQNMGEVIEPSRLDTVCRHWYPVPGGLKQSYLIASVRCLEMLSKKCGTGGDVCSLSHEHVWTFTDASIFDPCVSCMQNPKLCTKQPQVLGKRRKNGMLTLQPNCKNGAVIFGLKRKDPAKLSRYHPGIESEGWKAARDPVAEEVNVGNVDEPTMPIVLQAKESRLDGEAIWIRTRWHMATIFILTTSLVLIRMQVQSAWSSASSWIAKIAEWWQTVVILVLLYLLLHRAT